MMRLCLLAWLLVSGGVCGCSFYIRLRDHTDTYLRQGTDSAVIVSPRKTEWSLRMLHFTEDITLLLGKIHKKMQDEKGYLAVLNNGEDVRIIPGTVETKWLRAFSFIKVAGGGFLLKTQVNRAEETNVVTLKGSDVILTDGTNASLSTWVAEEVLGCEDEKYAAYLDSDVTKRKTTSPPTTSPTTTLPPTTLPTTTSPPTTSLSTPGSMQYKCYDPLGPKMCVTSVTEEGLNKAIKKEIEIFNQDMDLMNASDGNKKVKKEDMAWKFAENVENFGMKMADNLKGDASFHIEVESLKMTVSKQKLPFAFGSSDVSSPSDGIKVDGTRNISISCVGVKYQKIHESLQRNIEVEDSTGETSPVFKYNLNSQLISASVSINSLIKLVTVKLRHFNQVSKNSSICAFWKKDGNNKGMWSTDGCMKVTILSTKDSTTCLCTHLTNFAILTAVTTFEISSSHSNALSNITMYCSGLSLAFLFIGIILFILLLCGVKKNPRYIIHFNLMLSLFVAQLIFIFGVEATEDKVLCKGIAYLLHYFFLGSFGWMLVEGLYLYLAVVKVFCDAKRWIRFYFLLGWGLPGIVVGITGAVNHEGYATERYCWLSSNSFTIWAFVGPVLAVVVINGVILVMVLRQIVKLSKSEGLSDDLKTALRSSAILLPVLGITWVFGVLSFNSDTVLFQYLFALTNSLQGFLVTLFHCFLNGEVRKSLKRRLLVIFLSSSISHHKMNIRSVMASKSGRYDVSAASSSVLMISHTSQYKSASNTSEIEI